MAPNEPCYYHERAKSYLLTGIIHLYIYIYIYIFIYCLFIDEFENSVNDFNKVIEF